MLLPFGNANQRNKNHAPLTDLNVRPVRCKVCKVPQNAAKPRFSLMSSHNRVIPCCRRVMPLYFRVMPCGGLAHLFFEYIFP